MRRPLLLLPALILLASCDNVAPVALFDGASTDLAVLSADAAEAGADGGAFADAVDAARDVTDASDAVDGGDAPDGEGLGDSALRWDILLPDVPPSIDAGADVPAPAEDRVLPMMDAVALDDRPDIVIAPPDVVVPMDRPDVVIPMDRPDVVIPMDRPDVVIPMDRPDVVVAPDRPDVVVAPDRPDVVVPTDTPDVVVAPDRPDVATDLGALDAGGLPPADPVAYSGTLPVRTGSFTSSITVNGNRRSVRVHVPTNAGSNPPLLLVFHGTNGDGPGVMTESNAVSLANAEGVVVAAPSSRWLPVGDFDHATEETYWETQRNTDPDANEDVLLVRAIMVEAQRAYGVDPTRIYAMGHSNGAFFAGFIATLLRDRIAAFSENSGGLVTCARTTSCRFQGSGSTCGVLAMRAGWCNCAGPELPMPLATTGRRVPGFITHGTADPLVSVYYSCTLQARMSALGMPVQITLFNGEGHAIPPNWAQLVWPFFRPIRLTP